MDNAFTQIIKENIGEDAIKKLVRQYLSTNECKKDIGKMVQSHMKDTIDDMFNGINHSECIQKNDAMSKTINGYFKEQVPLITLELLENEKNQIKIQKAIQGFIDYTFEQEFDEYYGDIISTMVETKIKEIIENTLIVYKPSKSSKKTSCHEK
jgi:hypothetical protein